MKKKTLKIIQCTLAILALVSFMFIARNQKASESSPPQRFSLDSENTIDRTIGVLIALENGEREKAKKVFEGIENEILFNTTEFRNKYRVHSKAMLTYFLVRIRAKGIDFDDKVIYEVEPFTLTTTRISRMWYYLTHEERRKLHDYPHKNDDWSPIRKPDDDEEGPRTCVCCGYDEDMWEYVTWKSGQGKKPTKGDWAIVP